MFGYELIQISSSLFFNGNKNFIIILHHFIKHYIRCWKGWKLAPFSSAEQTKKELIGLGGSGSHFISDYHVIFVSGVEQVVVMTHLNPHMNMAYIDLNGS